MDVLQDLNTTWEQQLDDVHAQVWERMKALGVTAGWIDPSADAKAAPRAQATYGREFGGRARDGYEFVVRLGREQLTTGTLNGRSPNNHVTALLVQAANALERRGLTVMPHIPEP